MPISRYYIANPLFSKDDWITTFTTTDTLTYDTYADNVKYWCRTIAEKHFNCPFCGAPNQIDFCEYCGSAYEGDNE